MKSIAGPAIRGFSNCLLPPCAAPPKCEVRPPPHLRLPALELHIPALRPHARLEDEREADPRDDDPSGSRNRADERRNDEQRDADRQNGPFDDRMVDEPPPLLPAEHAC